MSREAVAERFQISLSSTNRWVQRAAATGSAAALPMGGKKPLSLAEQADWINARIAEKPGITGRELLTELHERHIQVDYFAVRNFLDRAGLTFKKRCTPVSKAAAMCPAA
jgi:transposase